MKKIIVGMLTLVVFAVILCIPQISYAADNAGLRYTITVTKFENKSNWAGQWDLGDGWGTTFTDALNSTGKVVVLAENDMRAEALNEQRQNGANGKIMPAQLLVKGAITHVQNTSNSGGGLKIGGIVLGGASSATEINLTIYIVETATGRVVASKSIVGTSKSGGMLVGFGGGFFGNQHKDNLGKAVENAASQAATWMLDQLPQIKWTGSVVLNKDGKIFINRGAREGVKLGQNFVVGNATVLRDPDTNEVLDEEVAQIGAIKVVNVKEKIAICEMVDGDAGEVAKGMRVILP